MKTNEINSNDIAMRYIENRDENWIELLLNIEAQFNSIPTKGIYSYWISLKDGNK